MNQRICIAGANGRMGRALLMCAREAGLVVTGGTHAPGQVGEDVGRLSGGDPTGLMTSQNVAQAADDADIFIDFTTPPATCAALAALAPTPVRAVIIGTTGFAPEQDAAIAAHASRFVIVKSGNFSLGINLLSALVRLASERLSAADWDIEILETHHRHKVDAPSGTALMLGHAAAEGRGGTLDHLRRPPDNGQTGPRPDGSIGFSVRRAGAIAGEHEVLFASRSETLTLGHSALDRRVFADGALHAARWTAGRAPGLYDMADVLGMG